MSAPEKHPVKTRILISEEHPLLRHGVAHFLNSQPDMIVCDETDNIRDTRRKIHECKPQLLLTALRLGTGDSLEFVKALKLSRAIARTLNTSSTRVGAATWLACAKKYVEVTFVPPTNIISRCKKKVVRFPAA
jgi:chemotaxis response regulator CheB